MIFKEEFTEALKFLVPFVGLLAGVYWVNSKVEPEYLPSEKMKQEAFEFCNDAFLSLGYERSEVKLKSIAASRRAIRKAGSVDIFNVDWLTEYDEPVVCIVERRVNKKMIVGFDFDGKNYIPNLKELEKNVGTDQ